MDLVTKISSLVANVINPVDLFQWWNTLEDTPSIPRYWKMKGEVAVLKSFGSNGTVIDLQPYTNLLATKKNIHIKGWVSTPNSIVLVVDPKGLPSDLLYPYLILAMSSDLMDYELIINQIKNNPVNPCQFSIPARIGYRDRLRRKVRFDIPEELQ